MNDPISMGMESSGGAAVFDTTHWSVVLRAGGEVSTESAAALQQLCQAYWYPLYAYARRQGQMPQNAPDLVQEFFARFLERNHIRRADRARGRFRTFLLTSFKNFLVNEWRQANRQKRGAGRNIIPLDELAAESRFASEPSIEQSPDSFYDRGWAAVLLDRAMAGLRAESALAKKPETFERLKPFVWGEESAVPLAIVAGQLGITEGAARVAVHRLRHRFGELLRSEVAQTVATPAEVNEELRYLASVLRDAAHAG